MALRARKVSGAFEKRPPGSKIKGSKGEGANMVKKNILMSVCNAPVLLLTMKIHSYSDNVMTKFMVNNRTDA